MNNNTNNNKTTTAAERGERTKSSKKSLKKSPSFKSTGGNVGGAESANRLKKLRKQALVSVKSQSSTLEISSSTETRKSSHATATAPHRKSSSETPPTSHSVTTTRRKKSKKKVTVPSKLKIKVSRNIDNTIINNTIINNTIINNTIINNIIKDSRIPSTSTATSTEGASNQTLRTNDFSELSQSHQQYSNNDRGGDFYDIGLRWHNICEDPIDEFRRIEAYKANRRLRYNNANDTKIALLTIKERKF